MPEGKEFNMQEDVRIMNITNGDEVQGNWGTEEEAQEWIEEQDFPKFYAIKK